ncbi:hypothetical protein H2248_011205 [Termitomyces sp. 'cryptogamus']|nr:hypothetical protein H2248_011205 [Termitomyces sp. 'cryptogamus']
MWIVTTCRPRVWEFLFRFSEIDVGAGSYKEEGVLFVYSITTTRTMSRPVISLFTLDSERSKDCTKQPATSPNFHASDADIVVRWSDNILFHVHRKNLETHAAGFPSSEFDAKGEIVPLTEDASTLENLLRYMYPQRIPDIELLAFDHLYDLAEAADKYEVFHVMNMCKMRME